MDPYRNNQPLQFNMDKGMAGGNHGNGRRIDDRGHQGSDVSTSSDTGQPCQPEGMMMGLMGGPMSGMGNMSGMGDMSGMSGIGGMGYPGPTMNMMGPDPNMMMMGPMGFNQFGGYMGPMGPMAPNMSCPPELAQREMITLECGVLYPPPPGAPPRSIREQPPGCRTVFVGGLPEKVTEDNIGEIFARCGQIEDLRLSKKNFAHIRFQFQESVFQALMFSGYRLKLGDKNDQENTGRLHVDYAQARDDQYEFECEQRSMAREQRHRQQVEEALLRPPSPPPVLHFSDHEAQVLAENLKNDDTFMQASNVLVTWIERGHCNRRTFNTFYSLIQNVNSHVRRLLSEKDAHQEEMDKMKEMFKQRFQGILRQYDQIENVFIVAQKQKAWDHFSKPQRKNIDAWAKQTQEIKQQQQEEFLSARQEDEMEMSDTDQDDDDGPGAAKRRKNNDNVNMEELYSLREENDSLKCQLEAYKNEIDVQRQEFQNDLADKDKQIKSLQQALQGMQQQLISFRLKSRSESKPAEDKTISAVAKTSEKSLDSEISVIAEIVTLGDSETAEEKAEKERKQKEKEEEENKLKREEERILREQEEARIRAERERREQEREKPSSSTTLALSEKETKMIGLVACFLHVHPFGASTDYIWSYLQRLNTQARPSEIEDLMDRLPMLYRLDLHGVGASIERRWKFIGYAGQT